MGEGSSFLSLPLAPLRGREVTTSPSKFSISSRQNNCAQKSAPFPFHVQKHHKPPGSQGAGSQPVCPRQASQPQVFPSAEPAGAGFGRAPRAAGESRRLRALIPAAAWRENATALQGRVIF